MIHQPAVIVFKLTSISNHSHFVAVGDADVYRTKITKKLYLILSKLICKIILKIYNLNLVLKYKKTLVETPHLGVYKKPPIKI